jgi:hypothetical protein
MRPITVTAFVDWNSQIYNAHARDMRDPRRKARLTLDATLTAIAKTLVALDARCRFRVGMRLYHGWHRGLTPSENRRALSQLVDDPSFRLVSPHLNVIFDTPILFGDFLLAALPHRVLRSPKIHLPDTLRAGVRIGDPDREKMVDTAMACDIMVQARSDPIEWRLVLAEDDDLVPALFAAEAWTKQKGGRTVLIRREGGSRFLQLDGLIRELRE